MENSKRKTTVRSFLCIHVPIVAVMSSFVFGSCGGASLPPSRAVIENDVDGWGFRRYQQLLDVEVWVPNNHAEGHTASYARIAAEKKGRIDNSDVTTAFVTRYGSTQGVLRALLIFGRRLAHQSGYAVTTRTLDGVHVLEIIGPSEYWLSWPAKNHIIKLGGKGLKSVPSSLTAAYSKRYPSSLPDGALEGPLPTDDDEPIIENEEYEQTNSGA